MNPYEYAKKVFAGEQRDTVLSPTDVQQRLIAWQSKNFGVVPVTLSALGIAEEAGELCHAVLKHEQKIRGMENDDAFRPAAADAVADIAIYAINLCTMLRVDFYALVYATAMEVMKRDWNKARENGGIPDESVR